MVGHFKHSVLTCTVLKIAQYTLKIPEHKLILDEPTSWNSMLHMIERIITQKQAVILVDTEHPLQIQFKANQRDLMQNVVSLLKIFDNATFTVSKREVTSSEVLLPIVASTWNELEKPVRNTIVQTSAENVKNQNVFTRLLQLERKYLNVPPATFGSERLFSTAGIVDKKQSRLDPERVRML
ncbi:hypothetical protein PR048_023522, partial [Dryococelus australis]